MPIPTRLRNLLTSIPTYFAFIIINLIYNIVYRLTSLAQSLFTTIYIEHICGFKRKEKVISGINGFSKVPENVVLVYEVDDFSIQGAQVDSESRRRMIEEHLEVLAKVDAIKTITVHFDTQLPQHITQQLIARLSSSSHLSSTSKPHLTLLHPHQFLTQQTHPLATPAKTHTPLLIIFSNYESTCNIPSKYLINAQIAFCSGPGLFTSGRYEVYRAFQQFAESRQRNGK